MHADYYEVAILLGACFLVNYVTVDSKTNMSEGLTMIAFYAMIVSVHLRFRVHRCSLLRMRYSKATATWFYPGQPQVALMLQCPGSVAEAVASNMTEAA